MSAPDVWDQFMDRLIAAQRDIAKNGGNPYRYSAYVSADHYAALEPHVERTVVPVLVDPYVTGTDIVLRHEVRA